MPLSQPADQLIDTFLTVAFGREPKVKLDPDLKLRRIINATPVLTQLAEECTARGELFWTVAHENEDLERISTSTRLSHEVRVPRALLTTMSDRPFEGGPSTFLLGRELYCAAEADDIRQSWNEFEHALEAVASSPSTEHDYTSAIEHHLVRIRRHEAEAQVSGWNAVVSAMEHEHDPERARATLYPTWAKIYQRSPRHMANFIEIEGTASPRHSIARDLLPCRDGNTAYMDASLDLEPIGHRYFKGTDGLAHNDNVHYNQYAAEAISHAILFEQHRNPSLKSRSFHYMSIDMERLKLQPELVQQHGFDLHDLRHPIPYIDKCGGQSAYREFRHPSTEAHQSAGPHLDEKAHRDHMLYEQAQQALGDWSRQKWIYKLKQELGLKHQKLWEEEEEQKQLPELPQLLEQVLEWELKMKLGGKLEQLLVQRPELADASKPGRLSGLEMEPRLEMEPGLEMEQGQALWDEGWLEMEREMEPHLELPTRMDTEEKIALEQKLERRLEQKLEQENWQKEWQLLALDPKQRPEPWQGPWQQLWDELWQEQKQELVLQTLYPQDQRRDNLAAALVAEARDAGLSRIDMVEMVDNINGGRTVYAVQNSSDRSSLMRASVDYPQALYTPIDESSQRLEEQRIRRDWTMLPARQELEQAQVAPPSLSGQQAQPVRRR